MLYLKYLFLIFSVVFLFPSAAYSEASPETIKIGFITDLSGIGTYWGRPAVAGAKLAVLELSRKGKKVSLLTGDHQLSTKMSVSEAQKMISVDKVDALYIEFAPTACAVSPLLKNEKKLFLNNSAATSVLSENPYAFKAYLDYEKGCREIGRYWLKKGIKRAGMLKLNSEFAELCFQGARQVFPDLKVLSYNFSEDVTSHLLKLRAAKVEAVFNVGLEADMMNIMKARTVLNFWTPLAVTEPDALTPLVKKKYQDKLEGIVTFGFPAIQEGFAERLKEVDPDIADQTIEAAAMAYVHIKQMVLAIEACGSRDIKCRVEKMKAMGEDPTMSFVRWDNRVASYKFTMKEWKNKGLRLVKTFQ